MIVNAKKIIPLDRRAGYLEARRLVAEKGMKLPSNVLHDDYLVKTDDWKGIRELYPAWALEILAHPEKNGIFKKGIDVVDSETSWIVPAKYVPEEAVGRKGVGLLLVPGEIETKGKVVIHPEKAVVLAPFIQENGEGGKVDEATRGPLVISKELFDQLSEDEKRWLYRIAGVGVRPLARDGDDWAEGGRDVYGLYQPGGVLGVAGEATDTDVAKP